MLASVAERITGRWCEFDTLARDELARLVGGRALHPDLETYFSRDSSADYNAAGLRHGGTTLDLVPGPELVATQAQHRQRAGWAERWLVVATERCGEPTLPYRTAGGRLVAWAADVETGEILRVDAAQAAVEVAPDLGAFLEAIAIETADAYPPCFPFAQPADAPFDVEALHERVDRAASSLARTVGAAPATPLDPARVRRLVARYGLPEAYARFLACHASPTFDGLVCCGLTCFLATADDLDRIRSGYEALPAPWLVIGIEDEGCFVLDRATYQAGDCAVRQVDHGSGGVGSLVADSFVGFLERVAEDTTRARAKSAREEERAEERSHRRGARPWLPITMVLAVVAIAVLCWRGC